MEKDIMTDELLARFFKDLLEEGVVPQPPPLHEYLRQLCQSRGETAERVIERAGIDRAVGDQLFSGRRKPSRDRVIQLAFGLGLDMEETQQLLKTARHTFLYSRIKRDAAIIYCLSRNMEIAEAQNVLAGLNLPALGAL